jgi:hypothetical protein
MMANTLTMNRDVNPVLVAGTVALLLGAGACKREVAPSPTAASATVIGSVSSPTVEKEKPRAFRIMAESASGMRAISGENSVVLAAGAVLYELTKSGLRQAPELHQGLHPMHYWESWSLMGSFPDAAYWYGVKRSPSDREDAVPGVADPYSLYRRFQSAWGEADWLKVNDSESVVGVVPWKDKHFLAVVRMNGSDDYRFALVGGKPGVALPIPTPGRKSAAPTEPAPAGTGAAANAPAQPSAASSNVAPATDGSAAPKAAAPTAEGPKAGSVPEPTAAPKAVVAPEDSAAPPDPTVSCPTILQPKAVAGNTDGGLLVVGYRCTRPSELVVERFAAGKRKSVLESLPPGGPQVNTAPEEFGSAFRAAIVDDGLAFVAGASSNYLVRFDGKGWHRETPEGTIVDLGQVGAKVWLTTSTGLFFLEGGEWKKQSLSEEASGVSVRSVFLLGDEPFALGTKERGDFILLTLRAVEKPIRLPNPPVVKTLREELVIGSPVCSNLFLVVKSNVKEKDNFDTQKAKLTGELAHLKLVVDNWKNGKLLGVVVENFAMAEKLESTFGDAKLTCHVPNVIRTIE